MEDGLCQCGCGEPAPLATRTYRQRGHIKGQPLRFIPGHQARKWGWEEAPGPLDTPCWIWTGTIGEGGYGQLQEAGRSLYAHRWVWTRFRGEIAPGATL